MVKESNYVQITLFNNDDNIVKIIKNPDKKRVITKKEKKITVAAAIPLALERLPKRFPAYENPYEKSLVSEVRDICKRDFLPDGTIMRKLRESHLAENVDHSKGIYESI